MTKKRNLQVSSSPSIKKQKSLVQKKTLLKVTSKKTSEPKFLLGLKRFLIQGNQNGKIHKKKQGSIRTPNTAIKSKMPASSNGKRKRMSPAKSPPVLSIQASRDGSRKRKHSAKNPPVLPIQASSDDCRQRQSPAKSPPVLSIQNQNFQTWEQDEQNLSEVTSRLVTLSPNYQAWEQDEYDLPEITSRSDTSSPNQHYQAWEQDEHDLPEITSRADTSSPNQNYQAWEQDGHDLLEVTSRADTSSPNQNSEAWQQDEHDLPDVPSRLVTSSPNQNYEAWEQDEHDLPDVTSRLVTSSPCAAPHMIGKKKILRKSNALCPAKVMPAPSYSANVRMGFDRNLKPQKIVKMAEYRGKDYFIMKWKGSEIMDIVPTEVAKERCPQVVIAFYEKHLTNVHNRAMDTYDLTT